MKILICGRWKILELSCQTEEQEKIHNKKTGDYFSNPAFIAYFLAYLRCGAWGRA